MNVPSAAQICSSGRSEKPQARNPFLSAEEAAIIDAAADVLEFFLLKILEPHVSHTKFPGCHTSS